MFVATNMSSFTDESTLPTSTQNSDSDNSSQSVSSSSELLDKSLEFLSHSWPLLDRYGKENCHTEDRNEPTVNDDELENIASNSWRNDRFLGSHLESTKMDRFRPVSQNSSTQSSPRTRQNVSWSGPSGCSPDASALYGISGRHYNPSGSGQHACQEISDYRNWANGYLQYCPHKTCINDLTRELADGQTLLHLVEVLLGVSMSRIHVKPALEVQKIENIQTCLDVLTTHGVQVDDVSPEDIVKENPKMVLVLCKCLRKHFGSTPGSPRGASSHSTRRTTSPSANLIKPKSPTASSRQPHTSKRETDSSTSPLDDPLDPPTRRSKPFSVVDIEDVALLDWVGQLTGQVVHNYGSFQDGHILCLLINKLTDDAVPDVVLDYGLPSEKVSLALLFSEEELGVTTDLSPEDVVSRKNVCKISSYLKELHQIFIDQIQEKHRDMELQRMGELEKRSRELIVKEKEFHSVLQCQQKTINQRNSNEEVSSKQGSLVSRTEHSNKCIEDGLKLNQDNLSSFPRTTTESNGRNFSKEKNWSIETIFPQSHFQDSLRKQIGECSYETRSTDDNYNSCNETEHYFEGEKQNRMVSSRTNQNHHLPRDNNLSNLLEESSYFLQEVIDMENTYGNSPTRLHYPLYPDEVLLRDNSRKLSPNRKLDKVSCFDEDLMHSLLPKENSFDIEKLTTPYKAPLASKSRQKERENATLQLRDFSKQLQLLKQEYFRLMNTKIDIMSDENPTLKKEYLSPEMFISIDEERKHPSFNSTVPKTASELSTPTEKPINMFGKTVSDMLHSSHVMAYSNVTKGTSPPYRTWSKYENTEGDRHRRYYLKKKTLNSDKNSSNPQQKNNITNDFQTHSSDVVTHNRGRNGSIKTFGERRGDQTDSTKHGRDKSLTSSQSKDIQEIKSRDIKEKRSSDAGQSVSSVDSQESSGRHLYGMTALVRLSSKKANALSDTDS